MNFFTGGSHIMDHILVRSNSFRLKYLNDGFLQTHITSVFPTDLHSVCGSISPKGYIYIYIYILRLSF